MPTGAHPYEREPFIIHLVIPFLCLDGLKWGALHLGLVLSHVLSTWSQATLRTPADTASHFFEGKVEGEETLNAVERVGPPGWGTVTTLQLW